MSKQNTQPATPALGQLMTLSEKLKALVYERRLSCAALGRAAGVSHSCIASYGKRGSVPVAVVALRIARVLGVPLEWLVDDAAPWPPPSREPVAAPAPAGEVRIIATPEGVRVLAAPPGVTVHIVFPDSSAVATPAATQCSVFGPPLGRGPPGGDLLARPPGMSEPGGASLSLAPNSGSAA